MRILASEVDTRAVTLRCVDLLRAGRLDEAISGLSSVLSHCSDDADARKYLGIAWGMKGDLTRAAENLEAAVDANSASAQAHYNLGLIYHRQGRSVAAFSQVEAALHLQPAYPQAESALARWRSEADAVQPGPASRSEEMETKSPTPSTPEQLTPESSSLPRAPSPAPLARDINDFCLSMDGGHSAALTIPARDYRKTLQAVCAAYLELTGSTVPMDVLQTLKLHCAVCGREYRDTDTALILSPILFRSGSDFHAGCPRCRAGAALFVYVSVR